jgi:hypothetical protein
MTSTLQKGLSYSTFVIPFNMPLIAILLYPGRTREQKEALCKGNYKCDSRESEN